MYGLFGKMQATPGQRDALLAHLRDASTPMPGCLLYVVNADPDDPDGIWIYEAWESQADHQASLQLESVQKLIAAARPLIAAMPTRYELEPLFGLGLPHKG